MRISRGDRGATSLFATPAGHARYLELRNNPDNLTTITRYREWLESLWARFAALAPPGYLAALHNDLGKFDALTWEMLLASRLADQGLTLLPVLADGPDLCVDHGGRRIWIECTLPSRGVEEHADYAAPIRYDSEDMQEVETGKNLLRCTSVIAAKIEQHRRWLDRGICATGDSFVIAIHGRELDLSIYESCLPDICGAVYPVGPMFVTFGPGDGSESGYLRRTALPRAAGPAISTTSFLDATNAHVTGILFSLDWGPFHASTAPTCAYVPNLCAAPLGLDLSPVAQVLSVSEADGRVRLAIP